MIFESPRLKFFLLTEEYFNDFLGMELDSEVMKFYTNRPHGTLEAAQKSFKIYQDYMAKFPHLGGFVALSKETNEFIGLGVFIHLELNHASNKYELGYRLPTKSWGKGYATEIAQRLLEYGIDNLQLDEIYGTTNPAHIVSQKVLLKIGMQFIGSSDNYGGSKVFKFQNSQN